jgi:hypothetical protein
MVDFLYISGLFRASEGGLLTILYAGLLKWKLALVEENLEFGLPC